MKKEFVNLTNGIAIPLDSIVSIDSDSWRRFIIESSTLHKARVIALFGDDYGNRIRVYALLGLDDIGELRLYATDLDKTNLRYTSLTHDLPEVHLFEQELFEKNKIEPLGHPSLKPVRKNSDYPFFRVEGDEIHEVAVGPVHAGIIEPGHFRFQCHGEKILHLEIRLGYQHRGIEAMFPHAKETRQAVLAESIVGDTVIGHALAYAQAMDGLANNSVTSRAHELRGIALELERIANHIGDLGMLSQDIGFLPAASYFGRLRGELLNLQMDMTGSRYGRSFIRPGGVASDLSQEKITNFQKRLITSERDFREILDLFFGASSVLARLEGTGVVTQETAKSLGLVGPVARASDMNRDVRSTYRTGIYNSRSPQIIRLKTGDVFARAKVRGVEVVRSLEFLRETLENLSSEKTLTSCNDYKPSSLVVSLTEGWRGEITHCAITDSLGKIRLYKIIDPSFHNWKGLEIAMRDGQISDFPLCNKSFNLSYAGHDL